MSRNNSPAMRRRVPRRMSVPQWYEARHELWYRGTLVKRLSRRAGLQAAICRAFEQKGWPPRIDDPLPLADGIEPKQRLHDAIKLLNRGQQIIHFGGDGAGRGVVWRAVEPADKKTAKKRQRP